MESSWNGLQIGELLHREKETTWKQPVCCFNCDGCMIRHHLEQRAGWWFPCPARLICWNTLDGMVCSDTGFLRLWLLILQCISSCFNLSVDLITESHSQDKNDSLKMRVGMCFTPCLLYFLDFLHGHGPFSGASHRYVFRFMTHQLPKVLASWCLFLPPTFSGICNGSFATVLKCFTTDCLKGNPTF